MAAIKLVKKPFKTSVMIVTIVLAAVGLIIFAGEAKESVHLFRQGWAQQRLEKRLRTSAKAVVRPTRVVPEVHEFMLQPGEGRKFQTNGARVEYRFYDGATDVVLYKGKYAKRTIRHYSASNEARVSERMVRDSSAIEFIRPPDTEKPLGYMVTIFREITN